MADASADRKGSDLVRVYVILFALFSAVLAYFVFHYDSRRAKYAAARVEAERLLTSNPSDRDSKGTPVRIYDLGTDILRFLETFHSAQLKSNEGAELPLKEISDRAKAAFVDLGASSGVSRSVNAGKKYVEYHSQFTVREVPSLDNFVKFLYNLEASSTSIRVLDLSWQLQPIAKNPYPPGNAISQPTFRLGVRQPLSAAP